MKNIIIYGFDYEKTEAIISEYAGESIDYSAVYVEDGVHREDRLLCHLRLEYDGVCPYIIMGSADILSAADCVDAVRYFDWVKYGASIEIENGHYIEDEKCGRGMLEYLKRQENSGFVRIFIH